MLLLTLEKIITVLIRRLMFATSLLLFVKATRTICLQENHAGITEVPSTYIFKKYNPI